MEMINSMRLEHPGGDRRIELYVGDLSHLPADQQVDILIISAFPNDYIPTHTSLIGCLHARGLSVADAAKEKLVDLREAFSCWMSKNISDPTFNFRRFLCFEPRYRGRPPEVVGDVFQALMPFVFGDPPIKSIAMPLLASGDEGSGVEEMLPALLHASIKWLQLGLPIEVIKLVEMSSSKALVLNKIFEREKAEAGITVPRAAAASPAQYDLFISYSRDNADVTGYLHEQILKQDSRLRVFVDKKEIDVGAAWQQEIYDALDSCKKTVALFSAAYLKSKVCKEEFNIAALRQRESEASIIFPLLLDSCNLPAYMRMLNYVDCRECNREKIRAATATLIHSLRDRC